MGGGLAWSLAGLLVLTGVGAVATASHFVSRGTPALVPLVAHSIGLAPLGVSQRASSKWAGYVANAGVDSTTKSSGAWVEPSVACPATGTLLAVFWVGLDGFISGSTTVEKTGTTAMCSAGKASYFAWWELVPLNSPQVISTIAVRPGDHFTASVLFVGAVYGGSATYTFAIKDVTTGKSFSKTASQSGTEWSSAECMAERLGHVVSGKFVFFPLADFVKVSFSSCTATILGHSGGIGSFATADELTMKDSAGKVLAQPSALTSTTAFSVAWKASS